MYNKSNQPNLLRFNEKIKKNFLTFITINGVNQ